MSGGDIKQRYAAASSALTVTGLQSLASAQDWAAGWTSASTDNTVNCYADYLYAGQFTTHASNRQAGSINVYVVAALNDTPTWTAISSGTLGSEGAATFVDTEERDGICRLLVSLAVDTSASAIYTFPPTGIAQLFGWVPPFHAIFIGQNCSTTTTAGLAAAGNAIYSTPLVLQYT